MHLSCSKLSAHNSAFFTVLSKTVYITDGCCKTDTMTCRERRSTLLWTACSLYLCRIVQLYKMFSRKMPKKNCSLHHNTDAEALKTQERFQLWTTTAAVVQRYCWTATFHKVHHPPPPWDMTFKYLNMCQQMCSISCILSSACNKNWFQHLLVSGQNDISCTWQQQPEHDACFSPQGCRID